MDVRDAVATRYSCRAFRPDPVPEDIVRDILERAAQAPSGGNLQPWHVHALTGARLKALVDEVAGHYDLLPRGEGTEYAIYPNPLGELYNARRFKCGADLYAALGIPREDKPARYRQYARNFRFFDAPVGLFFSIDRQMGPPQWCDLGMYLQNVMVLARAHGLHTCAQEAWATFHETVTRFLDLPDDRLLFCGMALGHAADDKVNDWRTDRAPLADFAVFEGFGG